MSELMATNTARKIVRRHLLTTVSVLALLAATYDARNAEAANGDADGSQIWIELGGQFDQSTATQSPWSPPPQVFGGNTSPPLDHAPPTSIGATPRIGLDGDSGISFQPSESEWIYSASVRYGRASRGPKTTNDQSYVYGKYGQPATPAFVATRVEATDSHLIVDFQAGKDLGLGMTAKGKSIVNFGVRIAQFNSRLEAHISSNHPTVVPTPSGGNGSESGKYPAAAAPHGDANIKHSFTGAGPSVTWDASVLLAGSNKGGISFDWSAAGAILFGRQTTTAHVATIAPVHWFSAAAYNANPNSLGFESNVRSQTDVTFKRSRNAFVPNVGGLVGISYSRSNAKVSLGYRADFFFGAIDGGVDTRKIYDRGFYGPFAAIDIGIGG